MEILRGIESKVLGLREMPPGGNVMELAGFGADIELAMERPLFTPTLKPLITVQALPAEEESIDPSVLFSQMAIDKTRLIRNIRHALHGRAQISLGELTSMHPLQQGLAELVAYLHLTGEAFTMEIDESVVEVIQWQAVSPIGQGLTRSARLPRIIFRL
jgi:hypothetical protein